MSPPTPDPPTPPQPTTLSSVTLSITNGGSEGVTLGTITMLLPDTQQQITMVPTGNVFIGDGSTKTWTADTAVFPIEYSGTEIRFIYTQYGSYQEVGFEWDGSSTPVFTMTL